MRLGQTILKGVVDSYRRIRNTLRFLLANTSDFSIEKDAVDVKDMLDIDRWAIARTAELQAEVIKLGDKYDFHTLVSQLHAFASEDLGSFYLDILKDRLYTTKADSLPRRFGPDRALAHHGDLSPPDGPGSDLHGRRSLCGLQPE